MYSQVRRRFAQDNKAAVHVSPNTGHYNCAPFTFRQVTSCTMAENGMQTCEP